MRLFATAIISIAILGSTWAYTWVDQRIKREASDVHYAQAEGKTLVEIERSFDCVGSSDFGEPAIKATFGGIVAYQSDADLVAANETVRFELNDVEQQFNTIAVFANTRPPDGFDQQESGLSAMLVRVRYNEATIAEEFFYDNGQAASIGGEVTFEIPESLTQDSHTH